MALFNKEFCCLKKKKSPNPTLWDAQGAGLWPGSLLLGQQTHLDFKHLCFETVTGQTSHHAASRGKGKMWMWGSLVLLKHRTPRSHLSWVWVAVHKGENSQSADGHLPSPPPQCQPYTVASDPGGRGAWGTCTAQREEEPALGQASAATQSH